MATIEELQKRIAELGDAPAGPSPRMRQLEMARGLGPIGISQALGWQRPGIGTSGMAERVALDQAIGAERAQEAAAERRRQSQLSALRQQLEAAENRQSALDLTEGRAQEILDDPYTTSALESLQAQMDEGALTDETLGLMQGRYGDLLGAQEEAAQTQLREQMAAAGLSPTDPAAQAQMRALTEQGQLGRAGNWRDLLIQQAMTNAEARERAAQMIPGIRAQQYGLGNPLAQQAAGYYVSTYDEPRTAQTQRYITPQFAQPQRTPLQVPQAGAAPVATPQPTPVRAPAPTPQPAQTRRPTMRVGGAGAPGGTGITGSPVAVQPSSMSQSAARDLYSAINALEQTQPQSINSPAMRSTYDREALGF